jgi:hypothetical protein
MTDPVLNLLSLPSISYHKVWKISEMLDGEMWRNIQITIKITRKACIILRDSVLEKRLIDSSSKQLRRDHLVLGPML